MRLKLDIKIDRGNSEISIVGYQTENLITNQRPPIEH